jgi:hypothetical protein
MGKVFYFGDKVAANVKSGELGLIHTTKNQPPTPGDVRELRTLCSRFSKRSTPL